MLAKRPGGVLRGGGNILGWGWRFICWGTRRMSELCRTSAGVRMANTGTVRTSHVCVPECVYGCGEGLGERCPWLGIMKPMM